MVEAERSGGGWSDCTLDATALLCTMWSCDAGLGQLEPGDIDWNTGWGLLSGGRTGDEFFPGNGMEIVLSL